MEIAMIEKYELKSLIIEAMREAGIFNPSIPNVTSKTYVYGQDGIARLFNCSISTASRILKSGNIEQAVSRCGRKIVVDAELALELVKAKKGGRKWRS